MVYVATSDPDVPELNTYAVRTSRICCSQCTHWYHATQMRLSECTVFLPKKRLSSTTKGAHARRTRTNATGIQLRSTSGREDV